MRISVIVPTFRRPGSLSRCLTALVQQQRPADEIVVASRMGDEETRDVLGSDRFAHLRIRRAETSRPGLVAAYSAALAEATGDVLAITDDDADPRGAVPGQAGRGWWEPSPSSALLQVDPDSRLTLPPCR